MPRMTSIELANYNAKRMTPSERLFKEAAQEVTAESRLHQQILTECKGRGWLAFHGSMAHATYRTQGEPDFIILADLGRVFFIEAKSKTGKLTSEQLGVCAWAEKLGHKVSVVRSFGEFLNLCENQ